MKTWLETTTRNKEKNYHLKRNETKREIKILSISLFPFVSNFNGFYISAAKPLKIYIFDSFSDLCASKSVFLMPSMLFRLQFVSFIFFFAFQYFFVFLILFLTSDDGKVKSARELMRIWAEEKKIIIYKMRMSIEMI